MYGFLAKNPQQVEPKCERPGMLFKPQIEGLPTIHRTLGEDGGWWWELALKTDQGDLKRKGSFFKYHFSGANCKLRVRTVFFLNPNRNRPVEMMISHDVKGWFCLHSFFFFKTIQLPVPEKGQLMKNSKLTISQDLLHAFVHWYMNLISSSI